MVRLQRGREISLGGSPAIGGRWPAGAAEPTRFELRVDRIAESDRHSVIVAGRREVGQVVHLPGWDAGGREWFWAVRIGRREVGGYEATREEALRKVTRVWSEQKG
jgi:hypothetical protein